LSGTYTIEGDVTPRPFSIETSAAHGVLTAFDGDGEGVSLTAGDTVLVQRRFQNILDSVEFAKSTEQQQARQVLRNLVGGTSVTVVPAASDSDA